MNLVVNSVQKFGNIQQVSSPKANISLPKLQQQPTKDTFEKSKDETSVGIFYIADLHGKMTNMERICEMAKTFNETNKSDIKMKLASGDIILGSSPIKNKVANDFLNWVGVEANALGNHELDATPQAFAETLKDAKYKLLAINVEVKPNSPMSGKIEKSMIKEINGEKFGIIGTAPSDALERVGTRESLEDIKVDDIDTTIKKVQEEVNRLKAQGINKIVVVSHIGKEPDKRLATETEGIDVILGAHTHDLYKGIKEGESLLYSKSGEPVILTQAGKDGEFAGVLNLVFNKDGVITKAQNNVGRSGTFTRKLQYKTAVESIIGKPEIVGNIKSAPPNPKNRLIENNPHGNFIADAMRKELGTDIALLNAANIRGFFIDGDIDVRRINDITPFEDKMMICELSEKQIVNAIKVGAKSFTNQDKKPGIILVSGLEYTVSKKGELIDMSYTDKNGQKIKIDVNNPSETKKYTVACDDFLACGGDNYLPVNSHPDYVKQVFDQDKNVYTANYIRKQNAPIEIKTDDRIKIVD